MPELSKDWEISNQDLVDNLNAQIAELRVKLDAWERALRFYAKKNNWVSK